MKKTDAIQNLDNAVQLVQLLAKMRNEQEQEKQMVNGTFNLYDINGISHLENYHSNILAFLIDRKQKHHHADFGDLFIQIINSKHLHNSLPPCKIKSVIREKSTDTGRRIDILLETESFILIIENKIYAQDQEQQLIDYYQWGVKHFYNKRVLLCYLTLYGSTPSEYSIPKEKLKELERNGNYFSLSYSTDILGWLQTLQVKLEEEILKSALTQYQDLVKGLCLLREENTMELKSIISNMDKMCKNATIEELKQNMKNALFIEQSCNYYLYINFLIELGKSLREEKKMRDESFSIYFTHQQERYELGNQEDWEKAISKDYANVGLELALGEAVGLGFELETILAKSKLYLGIMSHGKPKPNTYHLHPGWEQVKLYIYKDNSEWWKESVDVTYIIENLFNLSNEYLDINHIKNRFVEEWESNQTLKPNQL